MLNKISGKKIIQIKDLNRIIKKRPVVIDIGCGDGKLTYKMAEADPSHFFIGVDPDFKNLEKISRKIAKKPAKGGLDNILFLHGSVERLPEELENIASEIQVNFPWGTLLEGLIVPNEEVLKNIRMIAKDNCRFMFMTTYSEDFESSYKNKRNLPELSVDYFQNDLARTYAHNGFKILEVRIIDEDEKMQIESSWGKRILRERDRDIYVVSGVVYK